MRKIFKSLALLIIFIVILAARNQSGAALNVDIDQEIEALNLKIQLQKKQIESLQARQKEYQSQIAAKRNEQVSLNNQLAIIENRLGKIALDIEEVELEIDKTALEIRKIEVDSTNLDKKIEAQKEHISHLLQIMYRQEQTTTLEALLLNDSLFDFLSQVKYLGDTNNRIGEGVKELKKQKDQLAKNKGLLADKSAEMEEMKKKLEEKKDGLVYEQDQKAAVLEETKSSEKEFQALLARAKAEQNQAQAEIAGAENLIRKKMSEKDKQRLESGDSTIGWPVKKNYITATFHDPDYPYRKIIGEHSGVDIRAAQGSTLYAAADGYVAKVKSDGSKAYAYIMIIHGDNLATVYGHVSAAYVEVDQYVTRGEVIGKTGGTPGTPGSGSFSSGPHLHFEVRKNGLPVNPANYLP